MAEADILWRMGRIEKKLDRIEQLLEQMPQVMAATYLLMKQEADEASLRGMKASDLFEINPGKEKKEKKGGENIWK